MRDNRGSGASHCREFGSVAIANAMMPKMLAPGTGQSGPGPEDVNQTGHRRRACAAQHVHVEVKHRCAPPKRYTWELHTDDAVLPVKESDVQFGSWEEASQAGKIAAKRYVRA